MDLEADKFYLVYGSEDDPPFTAGGPFDTIREALQALYRKGAIWGAKYKSTEEDAEVAMSHLGHLVNPASNLRLVRVCPKMQEVV